MAQSGKSPGQARELDAVRVQRLRADARRPMSVNLAETIALSHELMRMAGSRALDGVPEYEELRSRAVEAEVLGVTVAVCSFDDLRRMKRAAGRGQDLVDLESLDAIEE